MYIIKYHLLTWDANFIRDGTNLDFRFMIRFANLLLITKLQGNSTIKRINIKGTRLHLVKIESEIFWSNELLGCSQLLSEREPRGKAKNWIFLLRTGTKIFNMWWKGANFSGLLCPNGSPRGHPFLARVLINRSSFGKYEKFHI